ncbi:MAG: lamin tail domain-containing protein, partial [Chloroflexi bacterium]|nr:lamin tail domain-containing protein [Chloroflexota bacterium]
MRSRNWSLPGQAITVTLLLATALLYALGGSRQVPEGTSADLIESADSRLLTASPVPALTVVINEVAWAGTDASSADEWIELYNPGASPVALAGWQLSDGGDLNITFPAGAVIEAGGFFLLERT